MAVSNHGKSSCRWHHVPLPVECWFTSTILHPKNLVKSLLLGMGSSCQVKKCIIIAKKNDVLGAKLEVSLLNVASSRPNWLVAKKKINWFCRCTHTCPLGYANTCKPLNNLLPIWSNLSSNCPGPMSRCLAITNLFEAASITDLRVYVITQTWS